MALWKDFGFSGSPVSTNPILPIRTGVPSVQPLGVELFVGRHGEIEQLEDRLRENESGSRVCIEGPPGSGKTSLVNRIKVDLQDEFLVPEDYVRFQTGMRFPKFAQAVVSSILAAIRQESFPHKLDPRGDLQAAIDFFGGKELGAWGGSLPIWLGGGGLQRSRSVAAPAVEPDVNWFSLLAKVAVELASFGYRGVLIHLNNLETMIERDKEGLLALLHDSRDFFQTEYCHFVLVGPMGLTTNVIGSIGALRSIFPNRPLQISPLTDDELVEVLALRYKAAAIESEFIPPVGTEVAKALYKITGGGLRATFQLIESWVEQVGRGEIRQAVTLEDFVAVVQPAYNASIAALPGPERAVLDAGRRLGDPFRVTGIATLLGREASQVAGAVQSLEQKRFLILQSSDSDEKWFRLDERVAISVWGQARGHGGSRGEASSPPS